MAKSQTSTNYPRISRPVELLRPEYDVVVVGSGYGGGVAASRMARGRQRVCVLERGKERWPGEYPSTFMEAAPQIHVSGTISPNDVVDGVHIPVDAGDPTGLYHLVLGQGQNAFVANGLGGTSLLNANIFLKADKGTLALKYWPEEIRQDPSSLDKYYARAEEMLQPEPYPESFPPLKKLNVLQKQAELLGVPDKFHRPPQTTRFVDGLNSTGVHMHKSTLSGQDSTGVNDGSKSTTLVTYVADAWNWGAEIFCECEVRYVKKRPSGEGYLVFFSWHGANRDKFGEDVYEHLMWVHAKKMVFLAAGALGTTEIVLRSRALGLRTSDRVGKDMSGNGDILAFGYNLEDEVNSVGREDPLPGLPIGPTITGIIDCRDTPNPLDGFVIEEGALASALAPFLQPMLELTSGSVTRQTPLTSPLLSRILRRATSRIFGPYARTGSIEHTQIYLVMSHDSNQANMTLDPVTGAPRLAFQGVGRAEHVAEVSATLARLGGTLVQSPFFSLLGQAEITVHAIGGMNLGRATNSIGEILNGNESGGVHDGLVVVDGALVPAALGVNPFATITALAERAVERVAEKFSVTIDYQTKNAPLDLYGAPQFPVQPPDNVIEAALLRARRTKQRGVGFTEIMSGFVHVGGEIDDFGVAVAQARSNLEDAQFFLSVNAFDEEALLSQRKDGALLTGTFSSSLLGSPHMVTRGWFGLFTVDTRNADTRNFVYEFDMIGVDGCMLHFSGYKVIDNAAAFSIHDLWKASSTLYVTVTRIPGGEIVGRGILDIKAHDFVREVATLQVTAPSKVGPIPGMTNFLGFFAKQLGRTLFAPFIRLNDNEPATHPPTLAARPVPNERFTITASDGVVSNMQVWEPTRILGGKIYDILLIPGASVDERTYALPTIPVNAIEYLTRGGYRCYSVTTRIGLTENTKRLGGWTPYDARLDVYAALKEVVRRSGGERVYVVAHCVGSLACASGILDGTIPAREWIGGMAVSQLFMHPVLGTINDIKANLPLPALYSLFARTEYFDCVPQSGLVQFGIDQVLRFYPVGARKEICNSAVCHRTELAYGRLWNHINLNLATHDHLSELFGGISMTTLKQLASMGRARVIQRPDGKPLIVPPVTDETALQPEPHDPALEHLRGIPILFFSGADNVVFAPEGTDASYSLLRNVFGAELYERVLFKGRGHLDSWISATCADEGDVFDTVLRHADAICRCGALGTGEDGHSAGKREFVCAHPVPNAT